MNRFAAFSQGERYLIELALMRLARDTGIHGCLEHAPLAPLVYRLAQECMELDEKERIPPHVRL